MQRTRWWGPCLALVAAMSAAVAQDKSPLAQVPGDAPIVFHLRGVERTKGRVVTLINNALPDLGKRVQESIEDIVKGELGERQLKGLSPFGPAFLVFTQMPRGEDDVPPLALVLRMTDAKVFRQGFFTEQERKSIAKSPGGYETIIFRDQPAYLLERGEYLVVTPHKESLRAFQQLEKSLQGKLSAEAGKRFLDNDFGVYVDVGEVYKAYGQTVRDARQFLDLGLQQAGGQIDKDQIAFLKALVDGMLQGFSDSRGFMVTADFRPDGLALHSRLTFASDTVTNQLLKQLTPTNLKAIDTLPPGQMTYMASRAEAALNKPFAYFLYGASAEGESKRAKALSKALDLMSEAGPLDMLQAADLQTEGLVVSRFQDAAKASQAQLQVFKALLEGETFNNVPTKKAAVKESDKQHRGFTLHHVDLVWDFDKLAESQPVGGKEAADAMRKLMGDGLKIWFGSDGKMLAQVTARDWDTAQKRLDVYLDGKSAVGTEPAFRETRKQLPEQANMLLFYDVPVFARNMATMFSAMLGAFGQGEAKLPPAKEKPKPVYLGVALTLKAEHILVDIWVPARAATEVQKLLDPLFQAFGG